MRQTDYRKEYNLYDHEVKEIQKQGWLLISVSSNTYESNHSIKCDQIYHFVKEGNKCTTILK